MYAKYKIILIKEKRVNSFCCKKIKQNIILEKMKHKFTIIERRNYETWTNKYTLNKE